jgi:FkbH-like protein
MNAAAADFEVTGRTARIPFTDVADLRFRLLGGCLIHYAADALRELAPEYGINASIDVAWPDRTNEAGEGWDVQVYQPSVSTLMVALWDQGPCASDARRAELLALLKDELQLSLERVKAARRRGLLLVHGFSVPSLAPLGRIEFRFEYNYYRIVHELNEVIAAALRDDPDCVMIDEERILSGVGKSRLMDHSVSLFSHHAPLSSNPAPGEPSLEATFGCLRSCHAPWLFAEAYLDSWLMWSGRGRIKLIVVDLDNTLWRGVAGESEFGTGHQIGISIYHSSFVGIHQALKILKHRGVLLAVCSRNNEADAFEIWGRLEESAAAHGVSHNLLRRDDFVIHRINWREKPENVAEIAAQLGVAPEAILFIDDSAAERAAMQAAFPGIRTLGENVHLVRTFLLTSPCLQPNVVTSENATRSEMTKAQLAREELRGRASDSHTFLRELRVRLRICRVRRRERLARIVELVQRTTQFNTALATVSAADVAGYLEDENRALYSLEVSDRFTDYGLVGACLLTGGEVDNFVLSCRVIPLHVEVPFLAHLLRDYGREPVEGAIVAGPRNQPCQRFYSEAGFVQAGARRFRLESLAGLTAEVPGLYAVDLVQNA